MLIVQKSGILDFLQPSEPVQACTGIVLPFRLAHTFALHTEFVSYNY